jgi:predicted peptidase
MQKSLRLKRATTVNLAYLLYLPKDYDQRDSWPLLVFLHGIGERGNDLDAVKRHGPPKLIAQGREYPMVVASPQCPADRWWQATESTALVDELVEKYKIDQDRIYLTGLSMGGFGVWELATFTPQRFAALAPVCGGGEPLKASLLVDLPIWAFHGAKDSLVPVEYSQRMVDAVNAAGGHAKLTVYPNTEHDSWTETYANSALYDWLLQQKRRNRPTARP